MKTYLIALSILCMAFVACNDDNTVPADTQTTNTPMGFFAEIPVEQPEVISLSPESELRSKSTISANALGYPIIQLPNRFVGPSDQMQHSMNIRWRYVNPNNPEQHFEANGLTLYDGSTGGNTNYGTENRMTVVTENHAGKAVIRVFAPYGAQRTGWWGNTTQDIHVYLAYGTQVGRTNLPHAYQRLKHYYSSGIIYPPTVTGDPHFWGGHSHSLAEDVNTYPRKLVVATETAPYTGFFPMISNFSKGIRKTKTQDTQAVTNGTYSYLTIPHTSLKVRGTVMALNFKNEVGSPITILDIEAKRDAFAYDGYFGGGYTATNSVDNEYFDGYSTLGNLTGAEVQSGAALKFVETNRRGFSQASIDINRAAGRMTPVIAPSVSFGLYANNTTTTKGIVAQTGATTAGRVFLWGYPRNNGQNTWTVRVKYRVNGRTTDVLSKPQRVAPPAGGFLEGKAYLATIRVKPA